MSSRKLNDLIPEAAGKAALVKDYCQEDGRFELLIYCTMRSLEEQARLYRQSRPFSTIKSKMEQLAEQGFGFLADIISAAGPCQGPHVTNAAPGESWHNFAQAFDAVPVVDGKALWSTAHIDEVDTSLCPTCGHRRERKHPWQVYGEAVRKAGLYWAGDWTGFKEYCHAQLNSGSNPLKILSPQEVKAALADR